MQSLGTSLIMSRIHSLVFALQVADCNLQYLIFCFLGFEICLGLVFEARIVDRVLELELCELWNLLDQIQDSMFTDEMYIWDFHVEYEFPDVL